VAEWRHFHEGTGRRSLDLPVVPDGGHDAVLPVVRIATAIPALGIPFGGTRSPSRLLDAVLSIGLLIACGFYLYVAISAVYGGSCARRAIESIGLTVGVAAIVLGYRFVLLLITLYST
jgi:hypothetical protein